MTEQSVEDPIVYGISPGGAISAVWKSSTHAGTRYHGGFVALGRDGTPVYNAWAAITKKDYDARCDERKQYFAWLNEQRASESR